jgi:hypothetical protein
VSKPSLIVPPVAAAVVIFISSEILPDTFLPKSWLMHRWELTLAGHLILFGVLGFFTTRMLCSLLSFSRPRIMMLVLFGCLVFGALDELHQMFVPGRQAEWIDLAADTAGALIGAVTFMIVSRYRTSVRNSTHSTHVACPKDKVFPHQAGK